jgi:transposase
MAAKRALRSLARRIQALDHELAELLSDLDALTQAACPGLRQSYGIGVDGASILLTAAGDNPERLRSEASFAALCGASPLPASSGNTRRHRLNRGGNRQANAAPVTARKDDAPAADQAAMTNVAGSMAFSGSG